MLPKTRLLKCSWLFAMSFLVSPLAAYGDEAKGVIFVATSIITMDDEASQSEAVYVQDDTIVALGSPQELQARYPDAIKDETFSDKFLIPGLIDPHVHMILGAMIYSRPFVPPWDMETPAGTVKGLPTKTALLMRLKELDAQLKEGEPLIAYGYHNLVQGDLTRVDLDAVSSTRPILIWHYSGHDFYLNSAALKWAEITPKLAEEFVGIALDEKGQLTGRIYEDASMHLFAKLGKIILTPENIAAGFGGFEKMLARAGVTSVAELGYGLFDQALEDSFYRREYSKEDPYHLYLVPEHRAFFKRYGDQSPTQVKTLVEQETTAGKPRVLPQVKFFTDAAFYSQTMRLEAPGYTSGQSNGTQGLWVTPSDQLLKAIEPYWQAGLDARIHSNGDAAQTATLDAVERVQKANPSKNQRFVIEHAGLLTPTHLDRIAELKGGISAASHYVYYMGEDYRASIGERVKYITPLASANLRSIPTTLHSDAPLAPPYPLQAASVHMTRATRQGSVSTADEALTRQQALKAVTLDAAWAMGLENTLGSIAAGKTANFTVVDKNPLATPAAEWPQIKVWGVVLNGQKRPVD